MQTTNKKRFRLSMLVSLVVLLGLSTTFTACNDDDDDKGLVLEAFGPSPVELGGKITFIGNQLNKITEIVLPGDYSVTSFDEQSSSKIVITAPSDTAYAYAGYVTLKYNGGQIVSKTKLGYGQSAKILSFSPAEVKPGNELSISGTYLSSVTKVFLPEGLEIADTMFVSQTNSNIVIKVPETAQSGELKIFDGKNYMTASDELKVALPLITSFSDATVKPGVTELTINGSNLDLAKSIEFDGASVKSSAFKSASETSIVLIVPASARGGKVGVVAPSEINTQSSGEIATVKHAITNIDATEIGLGETITITGTDLDLVTEVKIGDGSVTKFETQTETEIILTVDSLATSGKLVAVASNDETAETDLTVKPLSITVPTTIDAGKECQFDGQYLGYAVSMTIGKIPVEITPGATLKPIIPVTLDGEQEMVITAKNGTTLKEKLTITASSDIPFLTSFPDVARTSTAILANGKNLDKVKTVKFGDFEVDFTIKNATQIYISTAGAQGNYAITLTSEAGSSTSSVTITLTSGDPITIWEGSWENTGWGGNQDLAWGGYDWSSVSAGAKLTFYLTQTELESWGGWQLALRHGNDWKELPQPVYLNIGAEEKTAEVEYVLDKATIDDLVANGGLIITGTKFILTKVTIQ